MKRLILFLPLSLSLLASDNDILSSLKKEQINIEYKKVKANANKLSKDWIENINLSLSKDYSKQFDPSSENDTFTINLNQPIFKSGGIYFAIKYADANEKFNKLSIKLQEKDLINSAIKLLYSIKKIDLQIEKQKLLVENSKIDVIRKKEQFEIGLLDSSFLDSAILTKNSLENGLFEFEITKLELIKSFKDSSDLNYKNVIPPKFDLISKNEFLNKNLEIKKANYKIEQERYLKNGTITKFLPALSIKASYINQKNENSKFFQSNNYNYETYGFSVTMPIDINMFNKIELAKLDYLKSKVEYEDTKRSEINLFENIFKRIDIIDKKLNLARSDYELYDSLLIDTKARFEAGEKTIYDVNTLKNSKKTKRVDEKILNIDKQLELIFIYAKVEN